MAPHRTPTPEKSDQTTAHCDDKAGKRIRQLRAEKGWSQDELARRTGGVSNAHISRVEKGMVHNGRRPSLSLIERFAQALETTPEYLCWGDDVPPAGVARNRWLYKTFEKATPIQLLALKAHLAEMQEDDS